ncbi:hypothetical protein CQW23_21320 [Capsicum baccatum]|uniref:Uncharacterized protein n=1 Tax=Capsicum baccatum TaxID=33114 RepID=A0A2G2VXN8_CAPBA|nr:hypothetical protein CQW23_21320 [Capsicum baccatum]
MLKTGEIFYFKKKAFAETATLKAELLSKANVEYDMKELQFEHELPARKDGCPSSIFVEDAVPNVITSDKHEHGSAEAFKTEGLSDVLDNCSLSQRDNIEEKLDSGFKEQLETGCTVNEGITYGGQEPAIKDLCPISVLADDALPNDITSDKLEHGAIVADNTEFDKGSGNEVLHNVSENQTDNMEAKLDSGFKELSETQLNQGSHLKKEQKMERYKFDAYHMTSNGSLDASSSSAPADMPTDGCSTERIDGS